MIDPGKWEALPFSRQMGNIASELSRACIHDGNRDAALLEPSLGRALELIDLTIEAQAGNSRTRELCRFREAVRDWYCGAGVYQIEPRALKNYALSFALSGWPAD